MNQAILNKIDMIARQLASSIIHVAPQAWQMILAVTRFQAISYLACALFAFVIVGVAAMLAIKKAIKADYGYNDFPSWYFLGAVLCMGSTAGLLVLIFSPWAWITAFDPQLGLAHAIMQKVLTQ
jgi:hypothetical protein